MAQPLWWADGGPPGGRRASARSRRGSSYRTWNVAALLLKLSTPVQPGPNVPTITVYLPGDAPTGMDHAGLKLRAWWALKDWLSQNRWWTFFRLSCYAPPS